MVTESVGTAGAPLALVAFRVSNGALSSDKLPDRLKLLAWGDNASVKGLIRVTDLTARQLAARQKNLGFEEVALDFEHNTLEGTPEFKRTQEPRPVAAYGVPRVVPGEGLFLENLRWTPAGQQHALNYVDLSPVVELVGPTKDEVSFIHSVALTRNGAVEGVQFFNVTIAAKPQEKNNMAEKLITLTALAVALGLAETATEAETMGKLQERLKPTTPPAAPDLSAFSSRLDALEKLSKAGATAPDLTPLSSRLEALETRIKEGATAQEKAEKGRLVALFASEGKAPKKVDGKVYSAEELAALDLPTLQVLHVNTPVTVALSARGAVKEGKGVDPNLKGRAKAEAAFAAAQG